MAPSVLISDSTEHEHARGSVTLRAADAPGYLADLVREAQLHLERAHALLDAAEQIMQKMADGEKISL